MGFCNFNARIASLFAPIINEIDRPWPMLTLLFTIVLAFTSTLFIIQPSSAGNDNKFVKQTEK